MVNQNIFRKTIKPYLYRQNSNQNLHTSQTTRLSGNTEKHTQGETIHPVRYIGRQRPCFFMINRLITAPGRLLLTQTICLGKPTREACCLPLIICCKDNSVRGCVAGVTAIIVHVFVEMMLLNCELFQRCELTT